jgi:hypothetical protein
LSVAIVVRDADAERVYGTDDLPLAVGGPDAAIAVPGIDAGAALARLGLADEQVFVQPGSEVPVTCNGRLIETSRWLRNGDTIGIGPVRIHCELTPERLDFRVHRLPAAGDAEAAAGGPEPLAPETIEPIAYTTGDRAGVAWHRRLPIVPLLLAAFFLRSASWAGSSSRPGPSR